MRLQALDRRVAQAAGGQGRAATQQVGQGSKVAGGGLDAAAQALGCGLHLSLNLSQHRCGACIGHPAREALANKLARTIWAVLIKGQPRNPYAWPGNWEMLLVSTLADTQRVLFTTAGCCLETRSYPRLAATILKAPGISQRGHLVAIGPVCRNECLEVRKGVSL